MVYRIGIQINIFVSKYVFKTIIICSTNGQSFNLLPICLILSVDYFNGNQTIYYFIRIIIIIINMI